jgi:hypothetical protein
VHTFLYVLDFCFISITGGCSLRGDSDNVRGLAIALGEWMSWVLVLLFFVNWKYAAGTVLGTVVVVVIYSLCFV